MSTHQQSRFNPTLLMALLLIAFGLLAAPAPQVASVGIAAVLAWILVFDGLTQLACAVNSRTRRLSGELVIVSSYVGAGVWLLFHPLLAPAGLAIVCTIFLFCEGVADIASYFLPPKNGATTWHLAEGIITCSLVAMIWMRFASSSIWSVTTLLGTKMLMVGFERLFLTAAAKEVLTELILRYARQHHATQMAAGVAAARLDRE